ncbi:MAG: efflux RND transporter periplasmic adaptor subunit [bacterium]
MRRGWMILIVAIAVVGIFGLALFRATQRNRARAKVGDEAGIPVIVANVTRGRIERTLKLVGNLEAQSEIAVFPKVPGKVESISVREGDSVKSDQLMVVIEHGELELQVKQAEAALESARASLQNVKRELDSARNLYESRAVSKQQLDALETQYSVVEAQLSQAEVALELARTRLENAFIRAPISGVVSKVKVERGDFVTGTSPVATIVALDSVVAKVDVIEKNLPSIEIGQSADIYVDAYPGEAFRGKVTSVGTVIDPQTRSAPVEISIDNRDLRLKPGMFASVNLVVESKYGALVIPIDAVVEDGNTHRVFVVNENKAEAREVRLGIIKNDRVEVTSGLEEGERIVVVGNFGLVNGDKVVVTGHQNLISGKEGGR